MINEGEIFLQYQKGPGGHVHLAEGDKKITEKGGKKRAIETLTKNYDLYVFHPST